MTTAAKWVVYATYDAAGLQASFAAEQVQAYRALGFDVLVLDASPTVSTSRAADWERFATRWHRRENAGYDFGSYREGIAYLIERLGLDADQLEIVLTNDSCYGPYTPLADVFAAFEVHPRIGRYVFGMTDSEEFDRHLQSYWLYFRPDVLRHLIDFFATSIAAAIDGRESAVRHGELALSRYLSQQDCELVAYRSVREIVDQFASIRPAPLALLEFGLRRLLKRPLYTDRGDAVCLKSLLGRPYLCNPTLAFGTHLHFRSLLPLMKRQLVRENPDQDPFVPTTPPDDPRDNAGVRRWLRGTENYRRRYGR